VPILKKAQEREQSQEESNLAFRLIINDVPGRSAFVLGRENHLKAYGEQKTQQG
jgi:hypothetical protein